MFCFSTVAIIIAVSDFVEVKTVLMLADESSRCQKYVALYDFTARNFDELSLKAGDHVLVNKYSNIFLIIKMIIIEQVHRQHHYLQEEIEDFPFLYKEFPLPSSM